VTPRVHGDETGSTLLLTIFYAFLSLVLILMVTSASSLYLERKRLFTLADAAALAGAEAFDLSAVTPAGDGLSVELDSSAVDDAVETFVAASAGGRFDDLTVERAVAADERSATVTLSSYWRPPLASLLVPDGVRLEVTATARSIFY